MQQVITYQAPDGEAISITPAQATTLQAVGVRPRNHSGQFCRVAPGHRDQPTYPGDAFATLLAWLQGQAPEYSRFTAHYGLNPWRPASLADYHRYRENRAILEGLAFGGEA